MLYACYNMAAEKKDFSKQLSDIKARFENISSELKLNFDFESEFAIIKDSLDKNPQKDYMASRGEYLNSKLLAYYLGFDFVDPATGIYFDKDGNLDAEKTNKAMGKILKNKDKAVIAGFYGSDINGQVKTFSRGGSDVTGSIVARATKSDVYENWTDVSGMLSADPRIVKDPQPIKKISYKELRELSYMGASVLHEDAVFPVRSAGIPINIRNTNRPEDNGTWIVPNKFDDSYETNVITGIAGKKGFSSIYIEKAMMNNEVGFAARFLNLIAQAGVSCEHIPSGIDTMSVIVDTEQLTKVKDTLLEKIKTQLKPDMIEIEDGITLIAVVGSRMVYTKGVAAKVFSSLAKAAINIRMIDQGSSELNIIIGVDDSDYEKALNALYDAFFRSAN